MTSENSQVVETVGDLDPDTEVYHTSRGAGGPERSVHLDPECRHFDNAKQCESRKAELLWDDREVCRECAGESGPRMPEGTDPQATRKRLDNLDPSDAGLSALGERGRQEVVDDA